MLAKLMKWLCPKQQPYSCRTFMFLYSYFNIQKSSITIQILNNVHHPNTADIHSQSLTSVEFFLQVTVSTDGFELQEEPERRLAVQEALSMMSPAFRNLDASNLRLMEALLMQNIEKVTYLCGFPNCDW